MIEVTNRLQIVEHLSDMACYVGFNCTSDYIIAKILKKNVYYNEPVLYCGVPYM